MILQLQSREYIDLQLSCFMHWADRLIVLDFLREKVKSLGWNERGFFFFNSYCEVMRGKLLLWSFIKTIRCFLPHKLHGDRAYSVCTTANDFNNIRDGDRQSGIGAATFWPPFLPPKFYAKLEQQKESQVPFLRYQSTWYGVLESSSDIVHSRHTNAKNERKFNTHLQTSLQSQVNSFKSFLEMLFSNFGLAVCAARLERLQKPVWIVRL